MGILEKKVSNSNSFELLLPDIVFGSDELVGEAC